MIRLKFGHAYLSLQQRQKTATNERLAIERRAQVMRRVTRGGYVGDSNQSAKRLIVERVRSKEVFVLVITCRSPEVSDLLGTDLGVH
jgi:RNase P/RNase MRP subunit p30